MCSLDLQKYEILTHFGCNTNTPTVVKYTPECTYGYLGNKKLPGEDPRTPLPIGRTFKIGPATPLKHTYIQIGTQTERHTENHTDKKTYR